MLTVKQVGLLVLLAVLSCGLMSGGNIILSGHDNDIHCSLYASTGPAGGCDQFLAMAIFARNGSILPVLALATGPYLAATLDYWSIPYTQVDPEAGVPDAALFNPSLYSAIAVASHVSCGGCDNSTAGMANLALAAPSFTSFFNGGGGILAFASASLGTAYYDFIPASAAVPGLVDCSVGCFTGTAAGAGIGILANNDDFTHNFFEFPGVGAMDADWKVAETYTGTAEGGALSLTDQPITVFIENGTIGGGGISTAPEPGTVALFGLGMVLLAVRRRRMQ
ncbi:MAG: PEP-CTERM sorting domain-containing protein [Bryobacterales bacterium]|nr:PEP-CTERM sorting domain-containing protein [Bryobacterales bacterium]